MVISNNGHYKQRNSPIRKKRILFIVGSLWAGGIERQLTDISEALKESQTWEPSICCVMERKGSFLSTLEKSQIPVYECKLSRRSIVTFPFRFARLLRQVNPDIVHSHVSSSIPWQVLGVLLAGRRPLVFTQHNEYQYWRSHKVAHFRIFLYYQLMRPFIAAHTAVSARVRTSFAQLVGRPERDFQVIYNPVKLNVFKPVAGLRPKARAEMSLNLNHYVIGTVASLCEQKGHSHLLKAMQMINETDPNVHLVVIGEGPLRKTLEEQAANDGVLKNISFLGRRMDVDSLYHGLDCFVLPSLWEGFPLVIIEAMACGLPIIATAVGGIPEALNHGSCGAMVPPGNPQALAEAVLAMKRSPQQAEMFGLNARARTIEHFSLEVSLHQYTRIYEEVLGRQCALQ